jgi:hydrogenase maturation protease
MKPILLIGYGNQTRSDDGVGWYVASEVKKKLPAKTDVLKLNQLTLELAEDIKDRELVIFVDARVNDGEEWLRIEDVEPNYKLGLTAHYLTPETLLAICEGLYNKVPKGKLFSIKGLNFDFGEELSEQTKNAAEQAIKQILQTI